MTGYRRVTIAMLPLVATASVASAPATPAGPPSVRSLCKAAETPIFTCVVGPRRASICAGAGAAVYRYGTPGRIELASGTLTMATRGFSGGGETQITATNDGHAYTLFDRITRTAFGPDGRNDPVSQTGLIVRHGGRTLSSRTCDNDMAIPAQAHSLIPRGSSVPH